jgi:hypothetical protein
MISAICRYRLGQTAPIIRTLANIVPIALKTNFAVSVGFSQILSAWQISFTPSHLPQQRDLVLICFLLQQYKQFLHCLIVVSTKLLTTLFLFLVLKFY